MNPTQKQFSLNRAASKSKFLSVTPTKITILVISLGLLVAIAIPRFIKDRTFAQRNACIGNQKQIAGAVEGWALENKKSDGSVVTPADITPYLKGSVWPACPAGGTIAVTTINAPPTCTIAGHTMSDERDGYGFFAYKHPFLDAVIPGRKKALRNARRNACIANLKQIESMIQQWALENKKSAGSTVTLTNLTPYIYRPRYERPVLPTCPAGGTYAVTTLNAPPTCTIAGHTF